jgi:hypothetical protein
LENEEEQMNRRGWISTGVAAVVVAGLGGLGIDGLAGADGQGNDKGSTTGIVGSAPQAANGSGSQELSISAAAFTGDGLDASEYFNEWDPATLSSPNASECFNSGVNLPPGSKIKSVTFYYTAGGSTMYGELNRQDLANHTDILLASFDSTQEAPAFYTSTTVTLTANKAVVASDGYGLGVCVDGNTTFSGATIAYSG